MDARFVPALPFHLEPDCVERRGGLMRGLKIPLHDFVLKMQGGLMRGGGGGRICGTLRYSNIVGRLALLSLNTSSKSVIRT